MPAHAPTPPAELDAALARAVARLADDGCVAFPTETVWGLAALAERPAAVAALQRWKGRRDTQPISVLIADPDRLGEAGFRVPRLAATLIERFWPGPLTLVLPCAARFADGIARSDGAVGVRCSPHPVAAALTAAAEAAGLGPITATSLNRSGDAPVSTEAEARRLCAEDDADAPLVLTRPGADAGGEAPSTVVDLAAGTPRILRVGAISEAALRGCGLEAAPTASER